jgi:hypothetical protein
MEFRSWYWRTRPTTRGHFFPANHTLNRAGRVRACSRVLDLMYPSRTRDSLSVLKQATWSVEREQ